MPRPRLVRLVRLIAAAGLGLTLAACDEGAGHEIGRDRSFGEATRRNELAMRGELDYAVSLAGRFAEAVPTTITFPFDTAALDANAQAALNRQADFIRQFPEVRFSVYGHTDKVGSESYNYALGRRRADAVVAYLAARGISRARLEALVSYGETQPLIPTPERERQNRRTVTQVSGFVTRHPTILDGKYAQVIYREYVASAVPTSTLTQTGKSSTTAQ